MIDYRSDIKQKKVPFGTFFILIKLTKNVNKGYKSSLPIYSNVCAVKSAF